MGFVARFFLLLFNNKISLIRHLAARAPYFEQFYIELEPDSAKRRNFTTVYESESSDF